MSNRTARSASDTVPSTDGVDDVSISSGDRPSEIHTVSSLRSAPIC